jgi:dihydrofolate synthase/folylpolyglutamate synthase
MAANRELLEATARLDALAVWERRPRAKMRVGVGPMADLAARLGDPQKSFRSIHVANMSFGRVSVVSLASPPREGTYSAADAMNNEGF